MKKIFSICILYLAAGTLSTAQTTPLPYFTGFENAIPPWQIIRKGATPINNWIIDIHTYSGHSLYHGYPVGGTQATDDWFISPPFSFSSGGQIDSIRHFFSGFGNPQAGDTIALYLLQGNADPDLATRIILHDFRDAHYLRDNKWNLTTGITIPPASGNCHIAFRYRTINNWLDVRFDNLALSGSTTGADHIYRAGRDFTITPNPVEHKLTIQTQLAFKWVTIYDMTGKNVYRQPFRSTLELGDLPAGTYFMELSDEQRKGIFSVIKK